MVDRLATIDRNGHFYKKNYRRMVKLSFILVFVLFDIMGIIIYQERTHPTEKYFVTTSEGRLIEIEPLKE